MIALLIILLSGSVSPYTVDFDHLPVAEHYRFYESDDLSVWHFKMGCTGPPCTIPLRDAVPGEVIYIRMVALVGDEEIP